MNLFKQFKSFKPSIRGGGVVELARFPIRNSNTPLLHHFQYEKPIHDRVVPEFGYRRDDTLRQFFVCPTPRMNPGAE